MLGLAMKYRVYSANLTVNNLDINEIKINTHYEERHKASMSDEIIIELISYLDGKSFEPEAIDGKFQYFVNDKISFNNRLYKLIWLLEDGCLYVGAVNAYRRD